MKLLLSLFKTKRKPFVPVSPQPKPLPEYIRKHQAAQDANHFRP